jgi:hypothetical protein
LQKTRRSESAGARAQGVPGTGAGTFPTFACDMLNGSPDYKPTFPHLPTNGLGIMLGL